VTNNYNYTSTKQRLESTLVGKRPMHENLLVQKGIQK